MRIFKIVGLLIIVIVIVVIARTFIPNQAVVRDDAAIYLVDVPRAQSLELMSKALTIETISYGRDKPISSAAFIAFHKFLENSFPLVHERLSVEIINDFSLLYHWKGTGNNADLPVLILAHMDVVPVIPGTQSEWDYPPFSGLNDGDYIWGRGAIDDKLNIIASLQAVELMLQAGQNPSRDIYFAFGHDEEQGGLDGAFEIAKRLKERGIQAEFLIDEGGAVITDVVPGLTKPVAIISPAEKGIVTLELKALGQGGHSSMPSPNSSIGILATAITQIESNQFPNDFSHTQSFLEAIADELPFTQRLIMKNLWLFKPVVMSSLAKDPSGQAGMRTTTAVTVISGGVKANVLPISATALVNFRIMPGETPETVMARVIETIDDQRVEVRYSQTGQKGMAPSPTSPLSGFGWDYLTAAIHDTAAPGEVVIAPRLLVAATDTRHYREISDNHYRFSWFTAKPEDLQRIHGTNERIGTDNVIDAIKFFHRFLSGL